MNSTDPSFQNLSIGVIGAGGLGKEVVCTLADCIGWDKVKENVRFLVEDAYYHEGEVLGLDILPISRLSEFDAVVLAVGDRDSRVRIVRSLPSTTNFITVLHPGVITTPFTQIGAGSVILANTFLSCDVVIGKFALINPGCTISHDSTVGDFFTLSPGVHISGGNHIGHRVFLGTGACTRNAVSIHDDVIVGMGAVVVRDLTSAGTYVGNPAALIQNRK